MVERQSLVRIRPGERVPLDGVVTCGDPVFAGTINTTGELEFRVTAAAANTTLARRSISTAGNATDLKRV